MAKKRYTEHDLHEARSLARVINFALAQRKIDYKRGQFEFTKKLLERGAPMVDEEKLMELSEACRQLIDEQYSG